MEADNGALVRISKEIVQLSSAQRSKTKDHNIYKEAKLKTTIFIKE